MKPEVTLKIPKIVEYGSNGFDGMIRSFRTYTGKCFQVLFFDPFGTGKTIAADIIAAELNKKIYRADISAALSKHIDETKKNLDRIFEEALSMRAILFFEEADALFSEKMGGGDRTGCYNKMEIRYLLQKMEGYNGIVILAVRHNMNINEAFVRNMRFVVEFPSDRRKRRM